MHAIYAKTNILAGSKVETFMTTRPAYDDRPDIEKLRSQWNKINGIFERGDEWSAAIVRAATAAEIAANIAIRKRFEAESEFTSEFVDSLLVWANGLDGKFTRLIIPAEPDEERKSAWKKLKKQAESLNSKRNKIVHRGSFASEKEARRLVDVAHEVVIALVQPWEPGFSIERKRKPSKRKR